MSQTAAITVHRSRDEVQRLWDDPGYRPADEHADGDVLFTFTDAPGDRGTEIHVTLEEDVPGGRIGGIAQKLTGAAPLAKIKDDLRHFKQRVETGEVPRSDGAPEGERAERKLKQRPAQPEGDSDAERGAV